jgi:hypothetical protein
VVVSGDTCLALPLSASVAGKERDRLWEVGTAADGRVDDAWVDPPTDATLCVADKMKSARFEKPPSAPIHFFVDMSTN